MTDTETAQFVLWKDEALEREVLDSISLDVPWRVVERFSTLERLSGSAQEREAFDLLIGYLREWGIPHQLHEPLCFISLPGPAHVRDVQSGRTFHARPSAMSLSTGGEELEGELAYIGRGGDAVAQDFWTLGVDARGRDVAGKIVITEGLASPDNVADLTAAGALAAIFVNPGEYVHEGICTPIWGTPDLTNEDRVPQLPVVAVNRPDGEALVALAREGGRVAVASTVETDWRTIPVLVAEIGRPELEAEAPKEFVLLHGHLDSWYYGVGDNATGDAAMLELARVFWEHRDLLARSLRVAWWSGHSHGRYAGSTWYADTYAIDLARYCVAQVNCDSPGCRWADTYDHLTVMSEAEPFVESAIRDATGITPRPERPPRAGDYSFNSIGITSFYMLSSTMSDAERVARGLYIVGGCGGNIQWHTPDDLMPVADRDVLLRDMRMYALSILRALNAPLHPWDWRRTLADFSRTLDIYEAAAGDAFDFKPTRDALDDLGVQLDDFYAALPVGRAGHLVVERWNAVQRRIGRFLVPLNYSRVEPFFHDPAVEIPPLPDLAPALELQEIAAPGRRRIVQTHLTRGQNRVAWGIEQAADLVDEYVHWTVKGR